MRPRRTLRPPPQSAARGRGVVALLPPVRTASAPVRRKPRGGEQEGNPMRARARASRDGAPRATLSPPGGLTRRSLLAKGAAAGAGAAAGGAAPAWAGVPQPPPPPPDRPPPS